MIGKIGYTKIGFDRKASCGQNCCCDDCTAAQQANCLFLSCICANIVVDPGSTSFKVTNDLIFNIEYKVGDDIFRTLPPTASFEYQSTIHKPLAVQDYGQRLEINIDAAKALMELNGDDPRSIGFSLHVCYPPGEMGKSLIDNIKLQIV